MLERYIMFLNLAKLHNNITAPIVCQSCLQEYQNICEPPFALRDFVEIDVGFTEIGIQIWCKKHNKNICHIDFDGHKLKSDFRCLDKDIS